MSSAWREGGYQITSSPVPLGRVYQIPAPLDKVREWVMVMEPMGASLYYTGKGMTRERMRRAIWA